MGDLKDRTGKHNKWAALMAAEEINHAGGVIINASHYYIAIIAEDTDEGNMESLDPQVGLSAAEKMVNVHKPDVALGGFRTESLLVYHVPFMEAKIPFI
ncbi:MAG: hypothetical protein ACTSWY_07450, partial [Promethearchaeota archaeon]